MAIKILPNNVQIGSFTLQESATGITFDRAETVARWDSAGQQV